MRYMTGGRVVVDVLVENGVDLVFGIPGTHSLPIYKHLPGSGIRHVTPRHEQGAGYAADGYARSTGRPGVCLVTTGPGVSNIATALGQAYSDSIPLLVVSPGLPFSIEGGDRGYLHETKHQSGLTGSIAAWSHRAASHQDLADSLRRAFTFFGRGRPRPVHIEVPIDVLENEGPIEGSLLAEQAVVAAPQTEAVEEVARALLAGRRRGLVVGGGCRKAADEATSLAELLGMVVVSTYNGKGVVSERHQLSAGASISVTAAKEYLDGCDVVLAVGTEIGDSDLYGEPLHPAGTFVRIDVDPAQLQKNVAAQIGLVADAKLALAALVERLSPDGAARGDTGDEAVREAAALRARIAEELASDLAPWRPLHDALEKVLEPEAIVAGDAAMACYYGTTFLLPLEHPSQYLYPTGFCTLGYGLPAAIGAKLAYPDRQVMAILGDGGVMFTLSELATAAELGLALPVVVVTNGGFGEIRKELKAMGAEPIGTDFPSPDFAAVGKALGGEGARVTADELGVAVEEAFGRDRPTLIEIAAGS